MKAEKPVRNCSVAQAGGLDTARLLKMEKHRLRTPFEGRTCGIHSKPGLSIDHRPCPVLGPLRITQSAAQQTLPLPAVLPGPVLGLTDPKMNPCLQAKRLTFRQCKSVSYFISSPHQQKHFPFQMKTLADSEPKTEAQMLRQTLQQRLFAQKRQEVCLRDTLPCKAGTPLQSCRRVWPRAGR